MESADESLFENANSNKTPVSNDQSVTIKKFNDICRKIQSCVTKSTKII